MKRELVFCAVVVFLGFTASGCSQKSDEAIRFTTARKAMVEGLVTSKVVTNKELIGALATTPRQKFVAEQVQDQAYADVPLAADSSRYVPAPTACAVALEAVQPRAGENILQIGLDDGYRPAVLARIAKSVHIVVLSDASVAALKRELDAAGCTNVSVKAGDTAQGWADHAPYDAIITDCDPNQVPEMLADQLKPNGRLVSVRGVIPREVTVMAKDKRHAEMALVAQVPVPQSSFQSTASVR
jgi:protein-L-isoaspartate(D-aspartate) O-methyltransferase